MVEKRSSGWMQGSEERGVQRVGRGKIEDADGPGVSEKRLCLQCDAAEAAARRASEQCARGTSKIESSGEGSGREREERVLGLWVKAEAEASGQEVRARAQPINQAVVRSARREARLRATKDDTPTVDKGSRMAKRLLERSGRRETHGAWL